MKLYLAVKSEYFAAIKSGEKTEEYREANDHWSKRLVGREYDSVVITKGYPKRGDDSRRIEFPWNGFVQKPLTHKHFGPSEINVFAIALKPNN